MVNFSEGIMRLFEESLIAGVTVLMATHDMTLVERRNYRIPNLGSRAYGGGQNGYKGKHSRKAMPTPKAKTKHYVVDAVSRSVMHGVILGRLLRQPLFFLNGDGSSDFINTTWHLLHCLEKCINSRRDNWYPIRN